MTEELALPSVEWKLILPEVVLVVGALLILTIGALVRGRPRRGVYPVATLAVVAVALLATRWLWHETVTLGRARFAVAGAVAIDGFAVFFTVVVLAAVVLAVLL